MKNEKLRYSVSKRNFFTRLVWILLGISTVLLLVSNWGFWNLEDKTDIYVNVALPVLSCILYMLIINHMGKKGFFLTFIPVLGASAYLLVEVSSSGKVIHSLLAIMLCIIVAIAYMMTVFGLIRTKWLLLPIVGLPMAYRIAIEDRALFFAKNSHATTEQLLPEIAVLCMMASIIFIVFAMKKRDFTIREKPIEELLVELEQSELNSGEIDVEALANEDTVDERDGQKAPTAVGNMDSEAVIIASHGRKR